MAKQCKVTIKGDKFIHEGREVIVGSDDWFNFVSLGYSFKYILPVTGEEKQGEVDKYCSFTCTRRDEKTYYSIFRFVNKRARQRYIGHSSKLTLQLIQDLTKELNLSDEEYWGKRSKHKLYPGKGRPLNTREIKQELFRIERDITAETPGFTWESAETLISELKNLITYL